MCLPLSCCGTGSIPAVALELVKAVAPCLTVVIRLFVAARGGLDEVYRADLVSLCPEECLNDEVPQLPRGETIRDVDQLLPRPLAVPPHLFPGGRCPEGAQI